MKLLGALALASTLLVLSAGSRAEQTAAPKSPSATSPAAKSLAANCTGCHGPNGESAGAIPSIAGLDRVAIVLALQEYREGKRPATVMHQHAKGYTDQEFELLAAYFSTQTRR